MTDGVFSGFDDTPWSRLNAGLKPQSSGLAPGGEKVPDIEIVRVLGRCRVPVRFDAPGRVCDLFVTQGCRQPAVLIEALAVPAQQLGQAAGGEPDRVEALQLQAFGP